LRCAVISLASTEPTWTRKSSPPSFSNTSVCGGLPSSSPRFAAWKRDAREFNREKRLERSECFKEPKTYVRLSIEGQRRVEQGDMFFMTQLPGELASISPYDEDPVVTGPKAVNVQQTLLKIVNMGIYLKQVLRGQRTVVRTDLEWYGNPIRSNDPSLTLPQVRSIVASRLNPGCPSFLRHARTLGRVHEEVVERFTIIRPGRPAEDPTERCPHCPHPRRK